MKIRVLLIADCAFSAIKYLFKSLILNYLIRRSTSYIPLKAESQLMHQQGLQLAACSMQPNFPGQQWN